MKSTHLIHTANPEYSQDSMPWQVPSITIVRTLPEKHRAINQVLTRAGYALDAGQIAGRVIPLLIGRRAA